MTIYTLLRRGPSVTANKTTEQEVTNEGIFDKEIQTCKQMTKKADDTHKAVSFTETNEGSKMMTKGAMHP